MQATIQTATTINVHADDNGEVLLSALPEGVLFWNHASVYVSRGNGWYDTPAGYSGGPWYQPKLDCNICTPISDEHIKSWEERTGQATAVVTF